MIVQAMQAQPTNAVGQLGQRVRTQLHRKNDLDPFAEVERLEGRSVGSGRERAEMIFHRLHQCPAQVGNRDKIAQIQRGHSFRERRFVAGRHDPLGEVTGKDRVVVRFQTLKRVIKNRCVRTGTQVPGELTQVGRTLLSDADQIRSRDELERFCGSPGSGTRLCRVLLHERKFHLTILEENDRHGCAGNHVEDRSTTKSFDPGDLVAV